MINFSGSLYIMDLFHARIGVVKYENMAYSQGGKGAVPDQERADFLAMNASVGSMICYIPSEKGELTVEEPTRRYG